MLWQQRSRDWSTAIIWKISHLIADPVQTLFLIDKEENIYAFFNEQEILYKSEIDKAVSVFAFNVAHVDADHRGSGLGKRISLNHNSACIAFATVEKKGDVK